MSRQIWLHSDWHWRHENIYKFTYTSAKCRCDHDRTLHYGPGCGSGRCIVEKCSCKELAGVERRVRERFANAAEGDIYIEQRWREMIKPEDHVYCLGDLCMFRENHLAHAFVALFSSLPGHKRLIPGNHDHLKPRWYVEAGFEKIRGAHLLDNLFLTHVPVHPSSIPRRALGNVHGHTHQQDDLGPGYLNVSVERTNYEPIPVEEVQRRLAKAIAKEPYADVKG